MRHVFRSRKASLHHSKSCLHKHYEESGDERPHDVDRYFGVASDLSNFIDSRLAGLTAGTSLMVPVPAPEGSWAREGSAINSNIKMIKGTKAYINKVLFL